MRVNKKEFHLSKQAIDLSLVIVDQIVISDKFKHSDNGFKYFISYQECEIVKPLVYYFATNHGIHKIL